MNVKEESEKNGLKLNIQKNEDNTIQSHHFMENRYGKIWEQSQILFSWAPKSLWTVPMAMKLKKKKSLASWKKSYDKPRQVLKSRDIALLTKVHIIKAMVFPVVMYGCESWTIKKAEHQRIDAFSLWCWRRLLRVPWTARRSTSNPNVYQPWIFIGRKDAEAPILWTPDAKSQLTGKNPDSGKHWR